MTVLLSVYIADGPWQFWCDWTPVVNVSSLGVIAYGVIAVSVEWIVRGGTKMVFWAIEEFRKDWRKFQAKLAAERQSDTVAFANVLLDEAETEAERQLVLRVAERRGITLPPNAPSDGKRQ